MLGRYEKDEQARLPSGASVALSRKPHIHPKPATRDDSRNLEKGTQQTNLSKLVRLAILVLVLLSYAIVSPGCGREALHATTSGWLTRWRDSTSIRHQPAVLSEAQTQSPKGKDVQWDKYSLLIRGQRVFLQ